MSAVADILRNDAITYERKAADYAPVDPWENFRTSATFAGRLAGTNVSHIESCLMLIGLKISRLQTLGLFGAAKNESVLDTVGDLRVYLAILEAMLREQADEKEFAGCAVWSGAGKKVTIGVVAGSAIAEGDYVTVAG